MYERVNINCAEVKLPEQMGVEFTFSFQWNVKKMEKLFACEENSGKLKTGDNEDPVIESLLPARPEAAFCFSNGWVQDNQGRVYSLCCPS